jgi:hypothetical protein
MADWLKPAQMLVIDAITTHQTRSEDTGRAFSGSRSSTRFSVEIPGFHASVQTSERRPTFYFHFDADNRMFPSFVSLIRFEAEKGTRNAATGSFTFNSTKASVGMPFTRWQVKSGADKVEPVQPIQKGE